VSALEATKAATTTDNTGTSNWRCSGQRTEQLSQKEEEKKDEEENKTRRHGDTEKKRKEEEMIKRIKLRDDRTLAASA
jgi:hypothetical protein